LVFDFLGNTASTIFIAIWNLASVTIEHFLMMNIYKNYPALRLKEIRVNDSLRKVKLCVKYVDAKETCLNQSDGNIERYFSMLKF
jgi:hypothetical protein